MEEAGGSNPLEPTSCSEFLYDRQPYEEGFQPGSLDTPSRGYRLPELRIRAGLPPVWYHRRGHQDKFPTPATSRNDYALRSR